MKTIAEYNHQIGEQGQAVAIAAIDKSDLVVRVQMEFRQPVAPIVDKVMGPVDALIDKLEALIPGDQKAIATAGKAEIREQVLKILSEESQPEPVQIAAQDAIDDGNHGSGSQV